MIIETQYGKIEGILENDCVLFKGIPYAKAPVGERRFQKPESVEPWQGVFVADQFGCKSIQRDQTPGSFYQKEFYNNPDFSVESSEDCLYLNICRPTEIPAGNKLPVAVYVHGGAFMGGAGSNLPFVCHKLARKGMIVITINYRLGIWGFLCNSFFDKWSEKKGTDNIGLWDQIKALEWIQENIEDFGGDKEKVTVFGQSAGAMSLQILAVSEETKGLFSRMILQSGGGYKNPLASYRRKEDASQVCEWLRESLGFKEWNQETYKELLNMPAQKLQELSGEVVGKSFKAGQGFAFTPIVDGTLLTDDLDKLIEQGKMHHISYMVGANANDLTMENANDFSPEHNPMQIANVEYAKLAEKNGNDCFVYYFIRKLPGDESGAFHSAELWYVFNSLEYCWRPLEQHDYDLAEEMMNYWSNFIIYGNPSPIDGDWKCYKEEEFVKALG